MVEVEVVFYYCLFSIIIEPVKLPSFGPDTFIVAQSIKFACEAWADA